MKFLGASTSENSTKYKKSISKYEKIFLHFKLEGGPPNGSTKITYSIKYPDGKSEKGEYNGNSGKGSTFWNSFWYDEPAYGRTGTLSISTYDEEGNKIGSGSVKITN